MKLTALLSPMLAVVLSVELDILMMSMGLLEILLVRSHAPDDILARALVDDSVDVGSDDGLLSEHFSQVSNYGRCRRWNFFPCSSRVVLFRKVQFSFYCQIWPGFDALQLSYSQHGMGALLLRKWSSFLEIQEVKTRARIRARQIKIQIGISGKRSVLFDVISRSSILRRGLSQSLLCVVKSDIAVN